MDSNPGLWAPQSVPFTFCSATILQAHPKAHSSPDREMDPSLVCSHFTLSSSSFLFPQLLDMELDRVCSNSLVLLKDPQQVCVLPPRFKGVAIKPQGDSQLGELAGGRHLSKLPLALLKMQVVLGLPSLSPAWGHPDLRPCAG